jgi:hypothetical protein
MDRLLVYSLIALFASELYVLLEPLRNFSPDMRAGMLQPPDSGAFPGINQEHHTRDSAGKRTLLKES